jgi:serine/threonine protein kinase
MAPEQWVGETSSRGTDVWAIGMILFELCTGRLPYEEDLSFDLAQKVCGAEPAPRLDDSADVPVALADVVARCLEKLPDDRPSAQEVTEELRAVLEQLDQAASTTSPPPDAGEERPERDPSLRDTEMDPARANATESKPREIEGLRVARRWFWALPLLISVVVLWLGRDAWLSIAPPVTTASPVVSVARGASLAPTMSVVAPTPTALPSVSSVSSVAPPAPAPKLTRAPRSREKKALAKSAVLASAKPATLPPFRQKMAYDQMQNRARAARRNCKLPGAPGHISVSLRFMPSGNVGSVRTSPLSRAHAHPAVNCVAGHFGGISVPPFSGGVRAMTTVVSLR